MTTMSLLGAASYMPQNIVDNSFFEVDEAGAEQMMFMGTRSRHHMDPDESAVSMIEKATRKVCENHGLDPAKDIDIILTNVTIPDMPFTGCGAEVVSALGCKPQWVLDVGNSGCVSFVYMMGVAQSLMATSDAKTALICNVATAGQRCFSLEGNRNRAQAAVPGDGCGVALFVKGGNSPIKSIVTECFGENASDMKIQAEDGRNWWEPGSVPFHIDFNRRKVGAIVSRGNRLVPEAIMKACKEAGIKTSDIETLITNQPNPVFLRNWREAVQVPKEKHVYTFRDHGNLFGAAMPVCLAKAEEEGRLKKGDHLVIGGFSHAGDYAGAAVIEWGGEPPARA